MKSQNGFTLVELMITLAIAGILAALAAPSFRSLVMNSRISSDASDLMADLGLARSEAAKRGVPVSVCVSTDGATCTGGNAWAGGRIVFTDDPSAGTAGVVDGTDVVLRVSSSLVSNTMVNANFPSTTFVTYLATGVVNGVVSGTDGTFTICKSGYYGKIVSVGVTGRASSAATSSKCP